MVVVGTGILTPAHLTQAAISKIKSADIVHALVPDPLGLSTIKKLNSKLCNLAEFYYDINSDRNGENRLESYDRMVEIVLKDVFHGLKVCCIFYGHPGVYVYPSHVVIEKARKAGYKAEMLPAISAEDCLYADLGIDPGRCGSQSYEASQYLFYQHTTNTFANMILWQIGVVGDESLKRLEPSEFGLAMLADKLSNFYPQDHEVILYEASRLPIMDYRSDKIELNQLVQAKVSTITTLVVPPLSNLPINREFCEKWNIDLESLN